MISLLGMTDTGAIADTNSLQSLFLKTIFFNFSFKQTLHEQKHVYIVRMERVSGSCDQVQMYTVGPEEKWCHKERWFNRMWAGRIPVELVCEKEGGARDEAGQTGTHKL